MNDRTGPVPMGMVVRDIDLILFGPYLNGQVRGSKIWSGILVRDDSPLGCSLENRGNTLNWVV